MTPLNAALAAIDTSDPFAAARMQAMVRGYTAIWDSIACEVLAVEQEMLAPLVHVDGQTDPDWLLGGALDLALRVNGRTLIVDHKTSSEDVSPGSTYRARLTLNAQASHYMLASGIQADAFMFDVLGKLRLAPYVATPPDARKYTKAGALYATQREADETPAGYFTRCCETILEAPERYYAQIEVTRDKRAMDDYRRSLSVDSILIDTVREHGLVARNTDACFSYNRPCEWHPVCSGTGSLDDARLYTIRRAHEELHEPIPEGKRLLTVSRRASFNACRQKHDYRYEQGIAPVERSDALDFGTAIHRCLAAYWRARQSGAVAARAA